jgi:glyoxalase family protein
MNLLYNNTMITGFHHLSLVCANARRTLRFYTRALGLRLVKTTVDFDNPEQYHLYFGDALGSPGTLITAYQWQIAPKGVAGVGAVGSVRLAVGSLAAWQQRLSEQSVLFTFVDGECLQLMDPDGLQVELVEDSSAGATPLIYSLVSLSADLTALESYYSELLGMQAMALPAEAGHARLGWAAGGRLLLEFRQASQEQLFPSRKGVGLPHHFALGVKDGEELLAIRQKLLANGLLASEILERVYYKSVLTRDPDGQLVELSTLGPGVFVDEAEEMLGKGLMLPPWLEEYRQEIEEDLEYLG